MNHAFRVQTCEKINIWKRCFLLIRICVWEHCMCLINYSYWHGENKHNWGDESEAKSSSCYVTLLFVQEMLQTFSKIVQNIFFHNTCTGTIYTIYNIMCHLSLQGHTPVCGWRFEHADYITVHVIPMTHSFHFFLGVFQVPLYGRLYNVILMFLHLVQLHKWSYAAVTASHFYSRYLIKVTNWDIICMLNYCNSINGLYAY